MNIGWIFLICALVILAYMASAPWRRKEQTMGNMAFSTRLDALDARLVRRDEIISLLGSGQMIRAIKVYREDTDASLADAKAAVERLEQALRLGGTPLAEQAPAESGVETGFVEADELRGEIEHMLRQKGAIHAIKLYRERTGVGLRVAIEAVDRIVAEVQKRGPASLSLGESDTEAAYYPRYASTVENPGEDVRSLIREGKKIQAIKLYREQTGLGLREAKDAVDRLEQSLHLGLEQG